VLSRQVPPTSPARLDDEEIVAAALGEADRCAQSGEAAADDEDADVAGAVTGRRRGLARVFRRPAGERRRVAWSCTHDKCPLNVSQ